MAVFIKCVYEHDLLFVPLFQGSYHSERLAQVGGEGITSFNFHLAVKIFMRP